MSDGHELGVLLGRARRGDQAALDELLARVRPYLYLLVRRQLQPGLRQKLGESDIVQETLVKIHAGLSPTTPVAGGHFEGEGPPAFLNWVSQIVAHLIVDLGRRGKALKRNEDREVPGSKVFETLSGGSTPEQAAERAEKALQLAAAMERLPRHQREVLQWRVFEQFSYAQISALTGKSEGALRVVTTRAMEALRADGELRRIMGAGA
ncbi:RNA polymerase sigma factor [Urbifossiella limnaea]|uniref:ECF RNA polymerase sigma factor SigD n=1 Tax=Urbifossiella limnaea TaxID=2528023 RepID=A0A517XW85_9BACT|nr:sigma-70 family RNA polymerase sigma factor [Urbifossiella limnaea]QDU21760.1 ECF RNA polymerase sigma factor SigD [Urbifossiella limnaea]